MYVQFTSCVYWVVALARLLGQQGCLLTCLACLLLTCSCVWRDWRACVFTCSRGCGLSVLACVRAWHTYVLAWLAYSFAYVFPCLACFLVLCSYVVACRTCFLCSNILRASLTLFVLFSLHLKNKIPKILR